MRIAKSPRYECIKSDKEPLLLRHVSNRIAGWIEHCLQHCDPETRPAALPTRLVDVGSPDDTQVRLLETSDQMLRDDASGAWRYVALSHCWGDPTTQKPPLQTTLENINERLNFIRFLDLPKSYQDAIIVCRSLNMRYLWIDSLCIIQDDKVDWETESPRMAVYYENAYITIIPTAASSCHDGFLDRSIKKPPVEVKFQSSLDPDIKGTYFIGRSLTKEPEFSLFYQEVAESKWGTRGWTFCEGLFSKRRIYFGKNTIHWSCRKFYSSEISNNVEEAEEHNLESLIEERDPLLGQNDLSIWYTQYLEYSCRNFTIPEDRLPGISPLAKVMAEMTGDTYLAGLWRSDLHVGLLWYASKFDGPIVLPGAKGRPYIAPSWSWLARARNAEISDYGLTHQVQPSFHVLDSGVTKDGINPFGRVQDGFIRVQGQIRELPVNSLHNTGDERGSNYREVRIQGIYVGECCLDIHEFDGDSHGNHQPSMFRRTVQDFMLLVVRDGLCLKGTISGRRKSIREGEEKARNAVSGLILLPSGRQENEYCRAGIFESLPIGRGGKRFFENCGIHVITII